LWTTKDRTDNSTVENIYVKNSWFLKCHRNVTTQTNPLQMHN
jgi:hypothetical protein